MATFVETDREAEIPQPRSPAASAARSGPPLDGTLRAEMERSLGADFGQVRVHGSRGLPSGALAGARGKDLYVTPEISPTSRPGRGLIAHELAHLVQQARGGRGDAPYGSAESLEAEARTASRLALRGGMASIRGRAPSRLQLTELWDQVEQAATKGEVFNLLRAQGPVVDAEQLRLVREVIDRRFAPGSDDHWLAESLIQQGPEPLWDASLIAERVRRAQEHSWEDEPGNIEAVATDPAGESPITVRTIFFPGRSPRSALVLGGIHGSEPQGALVVERLRTRLREESKAGRPPFFTTILVPVLYERTHQAGWQTAFIGPSGTRRGRNILRHRYVRPSGVEPSRNFPYPGTSYAEARRRGETRGAELWYRPQPGAALRAVGGSQRTPNMLPEVRILTTLMERFNPERIVQVHGHSTQRRHVGTGAGPGITVDPRGLDPETGLPRLDIDSLSEYQSDIALTRLMVLEGLRRLEQSQLAPSRRRRPWNPFSANTPYERQYAVGQGPASLSPQELTVLYPPGMPGSGRGTSLGGYGPVPVPGVRQGATTLTIEVPQYRPGDRAAVPAVINLHADLLLDILLADPDTLASQFPRPAGMVTHMPDD